MLLDQPYGRARGGCFSEITSSREKTGVTQESEVGQEKSFDRKKAGIIDGVFRDVRGVSVDGGNPFGGVLGGGDWRV